MGVGKTKVPVAGTIGKAVFIDPDATMGADIGVNLRLNGQVISLAQLAAALGVGQSTAATFAATLWKLIGEIPANVVEVAALNTSGIVVRTATGHWITIPAPPPGQPGIDGEQGLQGDMGPPGVPGAPGAAGLAGLPGQDGQDGQDGQPGPPGPQGPAGSGATGAAGPMGNPGTDGADGADGNDGPPGPPGPQGGTGGSGPQGIPGNDGETGTEGDRGPPGPQGAQGVQGTVGVTGGQGPMGNPGNDGETGEVGDWGPPGLQGLQGPAGPQGPIGNAIYQIIGGDDGGGSSNDTPDRPLDTGTTYNWGDTQTFSRGLSVSGSRPGLGNLASQVFLQAGAGSVPQIMLVNSTGAADAKVWDVFCSATNMTWRLINDAQNSAGNWLDVARSGVAASSLSFGNATDNPAYNFLGTGRTTFSGDILLNNPGLPQIHLNSVGSDYGMIQNTSSQVWSLAHGPTLGTLGTAVLSWFATGQVDIGSKLHLGTNLGIGTGADIWTTSTDPLFIGTVGVADVGMYVNSAVRITLQASAGNNYNVPTGFQHIFQVNGVTVGSVGAAATTATWSSPHRFDQTGGTGGSAGIELHATSVTTAATNTGGSALPALAKFLTWQLNGVSIKIPFYL